MKDNGQATPVFGEIRGWYGEPLLKILTILIDVCS